MNELFNNILVSTSETMTISTALIAMAVSFVLGLIIAFTYYKTKEPEAYQQSMAVTLCMLPVILSVIILFVGSDIARAFSLAGTLTIIRFRSAPGDPKDIGFIFFDIAAGLACGVGLYGYGAIFVVGLCILMFILNKTNAFSQKSVRKVLKMNIHEDLNSQGVFDEIMERYTSEYKLTKVRTTDLGSLFELTYDLVTKDGVSEQEFINELRCRNGNLNIALTLAPTVTVVK